MVWTLLIFLTIFAPGQHAGLIRRAGTVHQRCILCGGTKVSAFKPPPCSIKGEWTGATAVSVALCGRKMKTKARKQSERLLRRHNSGATGGLPSTPIPARKTHATALGIVPTPPYGIASAEGAGPCPAWISVQNLARLAGCFGGDGAGKFFLPHIALFHPFVPRYKTRAFAGRVAAAVEKMEIGPLSVRLDAVGTFRRRTGTVIYLEPDRQSANAIARVREALVRECLGQFDDGERYGGGYVPHLTLGEVPDYDTAEMTVRKMMREGFDPVVFEASELHFIARNGRPGDAPCVCDARVALGNLSHRGDGYVGGSIERSENIEKDGEALVKERVALLTGHAKSYSMFKS